MKSLDPIPLNPLFRYHGNDGSVAKLVASWGRRLLAVLMLAVLSPFFLAILIAIAMVDGFPVFFVHYRVGLHGKVFRCYKFRTMRLNAEELLLRLLNSDESARREWQQDHKLRADPRVTPIGQFLRKSSLDELPQLLNIARGEMGFIGPRPITVSELARYGRDRWFYASVLPGMTGLWQVSGRNNTTYAERVALDRRYVETRGWRMDLKILFRTLWVVVRREGAS